MVDELLFCTSTQGKHKSFWLSGMPMFSIWKFSCLGLEHFWIQLQTWKVWWIASVRYHSYFYPWIKFYFPHNDCLIFQTAWWFSYGDHKSIPSRCSFRQPWRCSWRCNLVISNWLDKSFMLWFSVLNVFISPIHADKNK